MKQINSLSPFIYSGMGSPTSEAQISIGKFSGIAGDRSQ